ncbi:MAG: histidinol dehydrogenase [Planctomycetaceae bacterium]|nr:histidinol dehydrogenase [Planctomycetota bacterium]NUO17423.1 histidinol dehydrogenase [Planctomycetaceae bacterium]GIK52281.1 MAG: histidinol dehydrogenase [Planctomycetota bacterium]
MPDPVNVYEIGSPEFNAFFKRMRERADAGGSPTGDVNSRLLARVRESGDSELIQFAQQLFEGLHPYAEATVERILDLVARQGDAALTQLTRVFDGYPLTSATIRVSQKDLDALAQKADPELLDACRRDVLPRLMRFHERQRQEGWQLEEKGGSVGIRVQPLQRVALYVPGGKAFYPSSLMMAAVPAKVAGVKEIAVFTPPGALEQTPLLAALLKELGISEVYRLGGAQAIAAAAFGTEKVARVDKIVGPGSEFVALAKRMVFGRVDIDNVAGPSEVVVLFDGSANAAWVAADMLAQAEHDELAAAVGVTDSAEAAQAVVAELAKQLASLPREATARRSLQNFGGIVVAPSMGFGIRFADTLAPEHLEILTEQAEQHAAQVKNAGAIFVGPYAPEAFGDYCAGPNHVLPTVGTARFASALSVGDFLRQVSIIRGSAELLAANRQTILKLARAEGLEAHARSVELRS